MKKILLVTSFALVTLNACASTEPAKPDVAPVAAKPAAVAATAAAPLSVANAAPLRLAPGQPLPANLTQLTIIDREPGDASSALVASGSPILVHYTGWLYDPAAPDGKGTQFDSSRTRVAPFSFIVGVGRVIKGWDQGVIGMKINGKRTLIIPASLAYGERDRPKIPANSNLMFDIELISIVQTGASGLGASTSTSASAPPTVASGPMRLAPKASLPMIATDLTIIDQLVGTGQTAEAGSSVTVHYTGWLYDAKLPGGKGKEFDSSVKSGKPFAFPLGGKRVIRGWDEGVAGMKVKGKRTLIIPSQFGYGERGAGGVIPPNATLIFDVELLEVGGTAK